MLQKDGFSSVSMMKNALFGFLILILFVVFLLAGREISYSLIGRERFFLSGGAGALGDIFGDTSLCAVLLVALAYLLSFFLRRKVALKSGGFKAWLVRVAVKFWRAIGCVALIAVVVSVWRVMSMGMYTHPMLRKHGICIAVHAGNQVYVYTAIDCVSKVHLRRLSISNISETPEDDFSLDPPERVVYARVDEDRLMIHIGEATTWVYDQKKGSLTGFGYMPNEDDLIF